MACSVNGELVPIRGREVFLTDRQPVARPSRAVYPSVFGASDPRDANGDGQINVLDARMCTTVCNQSGCPLQ